MRFVFACQCVSVCIVLCKTSIAWLPQYVCSLVIKANPVSARYLSTGAWDIWQTTVEEEKPVFWFHLRAWLLMDRVQFSLSTLKKRLEWQRQRPPLGKPAEEKQFISFKIECPSWTHWGSSPFVTGSGGFVYKQGQRNASKTLFSLNFPLKVKINQGNAINGMQHQLLYSI